MSNTSDALAQAVQTIKDLRSADETPPGEQGDAYEGEMDSYVDAVAARFEALVNANDEVVADVRNTDTTSKVTTTGELSVGGESAISGYGANLSVGADSSLNATDTDTNTQVYESGEYVQMGAYEFAAGEYSASSTTFSTVAQSVSYHRTIDLASIDALSKFDAVAVAWTGQVHDNDSGADVTVRVANQPATEATRTAPNYDPVASPKADIGATTARSFSLEIKSSDGTKASVWNPSLIAYGRVA